jgi:glutamine cyclotransferase
MKNRSLLIIAAMALVAFGCKNRNQKLADTTFAMSPSEKYAERDGKPIDAKVSYPDAFSPDSIVYFVDSVRVGATPDSSVFNIRTDAMKMGTRKILARIYKDGKSQDLKTNVIIMPTRMPVSYTYKIVKTFPHDTSAHTQGLSYADGYLYESTGKPGHSEIRKVELETGKVLIRQNIGAQYSGKGSAIVGDKVVMFTERDKIGFVFDKNTLKPLGQFTNNIAKMAWGAAYDGRRIFMNDSTNRVWFLNPNTYKPTGYIEIYDHNSAVKGIDEMEYMNHKLYATINPYDTIIEIDPKTGAVLKAVNMTDIWPDKVRPKGFNNDHDVLNGIAFDPSGQRIFVTGGNWRYVFQIDLVKVL